MADDRLTPPYEGRRRGARPSDLDWLEHHHGDHYVPRHGRYYIVWTRHPDPSGWSPEPSQDLVSGDLTEPLPPRSR